MLLLDTYDTEVAAEKTVDIGATAQRRKALAIKGVRLDSGDLAEHARRVRQILDQGGLANVTIFASGNLDESKLQDFTASGAPIDGYGIGSRLDVSSDAPYLDCAYKLQEYAGRPRRKRSEGKATWPGRKQVHRSYRDGIMVGDIVTLDGDSQSGEALIEPMMLRGRKCKPRLHCTDLRDRVTNNLSTLPDSLKSLEQAPDYAVEISEALLKLAEELDRESMDHGDHAVWLRGEPAVILRSNRLQRLTWKSVDW